GSCADKAALAEAVTGKRPAIARQPDHAPADHADRRAAALRLWDAALPIEDTPGRHYLATRGLVLPDGAALRFLPNAKHPSGARCMCMIALAVDDEGRGQAVHRTYLAPGGYGKARLDPPRATLGPVARAAVRLCLPRDGAALVIGEGIETSLSAGLLTGLPAWAALSAGNMERVALPDRVREVWIASDHDAPGQRAAWQAADAFMAQGRVVRVLTPDTAGEDFNDIAQRRMARGVAHG
ncbi:MAG: toprim domain-containing protein, partial [Roseococcus sp.]